MKIVSLLLLTLLIGIVLVANGAPTYTGTFTINCPYGCRGEIDFNFANLDPSITYSFSGVTIGDNFSGNINASPDGTWQIMQSFLLAGNWEFTLTALHKNGKPVHNGVVDDQFFDVP
jgi:hypothetical protein